VTLITSELIRYCFEIENFRVKFIELNRKIKKEPGKRINLEMSVKNISVHKDFNMIIFK